MELLSLVLVVADLGVLISEDVVRGCEPLPLDDGNLQHVIRKNSVEQSSYKYDKIELNNHHRLNLNKLLLYSIKRPRFRFQ